MFEINCKTSQLETLTYERPIMLAINILTLEKYFHNILHKTDGKKCAQYSTQHEGRRMEEHDLLSEG